MTVKFIDEDFSQSLQLTNFRTFAPEGKGSTYCLLPNEIATEIRDRSNLVHVRFVDELQTADQERGRL